METAQSPSGFENLPTPEMKMKKEDSNRSRVSGSRRTRSQVAPDWTVKDELILVNEIAAVEGDCLDALSTYQKWKIIADNCNVLDVARTSNQCRRKWDSLLLEHNKIKQWESRSRNDSFWSLDSERRNEFGLPENFENELFKAIDDYVRAQKDRSDTDPDSDPEAEADMIELIRELGSKRQRQRLMPQQSCTEEKPLKGHAEEKPLKGCAQQKLLESREEEKPPKVCKEEKSEESPIEEHTQRICFEEKEKISMEEQEQMMAAKLCENAELIHAIVKGKLAENAGYGDADLKSAEDFQTDFARLQAEQLIACLGDIVSTLSELCGLVQECE